MINDTIFYPTLNMSSMILWTWSSFVILVLMILWWINNMIPLKVPEMISSRLYMVLLRSLILVICYNHDLSCGHNFPWLIGETQKLLNKANDTCKEWNNIRKFQFYYGWIHYITVFRKCIIRSLNSSLHFDFPTGQYLKVFAHGKKAVNEKLTTNVLEKSNISDELFIN